jgi:hypothetical protein
VHLVGVEGSIEDEKGDDMKKPLLLLPLLILLASPAAAVGAEAGEPAALLAASAEKTFRGGQQVAVEVRLTETGRLEAEMTFRDELDLSGLCAVAHFALEDARGRILEVHSLPRACIAEIRDYRTVQNTIHWEGEVASTGHLKEASSIEVRIFSAASDPLAGTDPGAEERKAIFQ